MHRRFSTWAALAATAVLVTGCEGFHEAMTSHTIVLAEVDGHRLTIPETAELILAEERLPAQADLVQAIAEAWIDNTYLVEAVRADPALERFDVDPLVRPQLEGLLIERLRQQILPEDTVFTEEELDELWQTLGEGEQVRARHILVRVPDGADTETRDSLRERAEELRLAAEEGEPFEQLAREHSDDIGSARQGGDLGFFTRGTMVTEFEEAAFDLGPGEISEVVETGFGYHVIQAVERIDQPLDEHRGRFRRQMVERRQDEVQQRFIDALIERGEVEVMPWAVETVRTRVAAGRMPRERDDAVLVRYRDGVFTLRDLIRSLEHQPPQVGYMLETGRDDVVREHLVREVRHRLLVRHAVEEGGISVDPEEAEEIRTEMRDRVEMMVDATQVRRYVAEHPDEPAGRVARRMVEDGIAGVVPILPLSRLRDGLPVDLSYNVHRAAVPRVVSLVERRRAEGAQPTDARNGDQD